MKTHGLTHVALAVRDPQRSLAFYRKLIGGVRFGFRLAKLAALALLVPAWALAANVEPSRLGSPIGHPTVAEALAALKAKPGVQVSGEDGWTIITDGNIIWSFTPEGNAAHPSAVKRETIARDGAESLEMRIQCEAAPEPCDRLADDFASKYQPAVVMMAKGSAAPTQPPPHPRDPEVMAFATHWLDLQEQGEADKAYAFLTDIFKSHVTIETWRSLLAETKQSLGALQGRRLRRVVWYENPMDAPLPGTYVAVEFDSVYANAPQHFRYVVLHAQGSEPFRVMRDESTVGDVGNGSQ